MSTPFSLIFELFLQKVADYDLGGMIPEDMDYNMSRWLRSACTKFSIDCKQNVLDKSFITQVFTADLTELEQEIVSGLMIIEWLSPKINTSMLLKQSATDKDFKLYSQANHIDQLIKLRDSAQESVNSLIMRYSYQGALDDLV